MSAKYYTQFILTDAQYRGGNEFSGVVEFKTFPAGDQRVAGVRCHTWSEDESDAAALKAWSEAAAGRLLVSQD